MSPHADLLWVTPSLRLYAVTWLSYTNSDGLCSHASCAIAAIYGPRMLLRVETMLGGCVLAQVSDPRRSVGGLLVRRKAVAMIHTTSQAPVGDQLAVIAGASAADVPRGHALQRPWGRILKRGMDLLVGGLLLFLAAPLLGLIAWGIRCNGRPILYRHQRVGRGGRPFACFKFRTMAVNADALLAEHLRQNPEAAEEWRRRHKLRDDPRITTLGAWLRRASLDELPQLLNVMRGEMSLVGPRPVVAEELARYGDSAGYYLDVAPGLTGLWQVSGRNDLDYRRRIQLDCWYVRNWSLRRDLWILLKTPLAVVNGRGAY
jgi:Undecaprenyl-phosphate galactose phosphotransferase WbaP